MAELPSTGLCHRALRAVAEKREQPSRGSPEIRGHLARAQHDDVTAPQAGIRKSSSLPESRSLPDLLTDGAGRQPAAPLRRVLIWAAAPTDSRRALLQRKMSWGVTTPSIQHPLLAKTVSRAKPIKRLAGMKEGQIDCPEQKQTKTILETMSSPMVVKNP
jgi:hypothetical protein